MSLDRAFPAVEAFDGKLYVLGGQSSTLNSKTNTVEYVARANVSHENENEERTAEARNERRKHIAVMPRRFAPWAPHWSLSVESSLLHRRLAPHLPRRLAPLALRS